MQGSSYNDDWCFHHVWNLFDSVSSILLQEVLWRQFTSNNKWCYKGKERLVLVPFTPTHFGGQSRTRKLLTEWTTQDSS